MNKHILYIAGLFLVLSTPLSALIFQYILLEKSGRKIHLFLDVHTDTDDLKQTIKQTNDLFEFVKSLKAPKEIIVEDMISSRALEQGQLDPSWRTLGREESMPIGIPDLVGTSPLSWITSNYDAAGIPFYNAEFREADRKYLARLQEVVNEVLSYIDKDGEILKDYYSQVILGSWRWPIKVLQDYLLNMRILHRLYNNNNKKIANSVVVAGGWHITPTRKGERGIYSALIALGYKEIYRTGTPVDDFFKLNGQMELKVKNISRFSWSRKQQIGKLYTDFINALALDISKLPRPEAKAKAAEKPTPKQPRSKL